MKSLFKILPILAIVVGIGGAWASQADENPCTSETARGYVKTNPANPDPATPPATETSNGNLQNVGIYEQNFECVSSGPECHWVYSPESPEATNGWIKCPGQFKTLP